MEEENNSLRTKTLCGLLLVVGSAIALMALLTPTLSRAVSPPPQPGDIAAQDYRSPEPISYVSEVLTEQRREAAADAVQPIYSAPDTEIARKQLDRLRSTLEYITNVRSDQFANQSQKLEDLSALSDIQLNQDTASSILGLTDSRWETIQQEAVAVLEKVMSGTIRPDSIDIAKSQVPNQVSLQLPQSQAEIVAELVTGFVSSNSEFSEELTENARERARQDVAPVNRSYAVGQTIALRGTVLDEADIEALEQLRLIQPQPKWQNLLSAAVLVVLIAVIIAVYLGRQRSRLTQQFGRSVLIFTVLFLVTLLSARLTIPSHAIIPYVFPVAAYSLTIAALFGAELAIVTTVALAVLIAFGLPNALDLTLYYTMGGLLGVLALRKARRVFSFFRAGAAVAIAGAVVIIAYRLTLPTSDLLGVATLVGASFLNGLASASIALLLQFFLAQLLGMTTPIQLMDLTRPDQPLLQRLLNTAPGTYQHSLQVANLAEQAAERIDADPLLTRVGALYHDIGKSRNPVFFIENQVQGYPNPHDMLDPVTSAATIIRHVPDGLELARKHRLPGRIKDFIAEHHGDLITQYQYINAVKEAGGNEDAVDKSLFTYPGPKPQSRETAIVMLADGCEARVRAEKPKDVDELNQMIKEVIDSRVSSDQLDSTDLTMRELEKIGESFTATLKGVYHPRVKYPQKVGGAASEPVTTPIQRPFEDEETDMQVDIQVDTTTNIQ
ncbi:MAG: HD family phosphohydrolase [Anaerolineales bacterium]